MDHRKLAAAALIGAAALGASARSRVTDLGRTATCRTASFVDGVRNLGGFEILFGTVLTKVAPELRRSAYQALASSARCPLAARTRASRSPENSRRSSPSPVAPAKRPAAHTACGTLV